MSKTQEGSFKTNMYFGLLWVVRERWENLEGRNMRKLICKRILSDDTPRLSQLVSTHCFAVACLPSKLWLWASAASRASHPYCNCSTNPSDKIPLLQKYNRTSMTPGTIDIWYLCISRYTYIHSRSSISLLTFLTRGYFSKLHAKKLQ